MAYTGMTYRPSYRAEGKAGAPTPGGTRGGSDARRDTVNQ